MVIIITGASRGIGSSIAKKLASNGHDIIINYNKSEQQAQKLQSELQYSLAYKADVSNRIEVDQMIDTAIQKYGKIDCLINNAGISQTKLFTDVTQDEWQQILNTNVTGVFNCTQAVLPHMIKQKKGKIINISSIWGMVGASCEVTYSTTKSAIIGFTKALAKEVGPSNIQVNCVAPGMIDTEMNHEHSQEAIQAFIDETPLMRIGKPEDIANLVEFLVSEKSDFITGQIISSNGGIVI